MATLAVRNEAQRVLVMKELLGQISDGKWENATPRGHWRDWNVVRVIVDPEAVGRDWEVQKDNYNFTDGDLLKVIGERMVELVRAEVPGEADYDMKRLRADLRDLKTIVRTKLMYGRASSRQNLIQERGATIDILLHDDLDVLRARATDVQRQLAGLREEFDGPDLEPDADLLAAKKQADEIAILLEGDDHE